MVELPFVSRDAHGRVACAWSVPRFKGNSSQTGLRFAAALIDFYRENPDATGSSLLARVLTDPEFVAPWNRGSREAFLASLVFTIMHDALPTRVPVLPLSFVAYGLEGGIVCAWAPRYEVHASPGYGNDCSLGQQWARRFVAHLQRDPLALSQRVLPRIVEEPEFRTERSRGLRLGFTCELARTLARVRLMHPADACPPETELGNEI